MTVIQDFEPDDEDENWISLDCNARETSSSSSSSTHARLEDMSSPTERLKPLQTYSSSSTNSTKNEDTCRTLIKIREKHQTQHHFKSKYVNQPLSRFPGLFLFHLVRELWHYNLSMRLGKITRVEHNHYMDFLRLTSPLRRSIFPCYWSLPSNMFDCISQYAEFTPNTVFYNDGNCD